MTTQLLSFKCGKHFPHLSDIQSLVFGQTYKLVLAAILNKSKSLYVHLQGKNFTKWYAEKSTCL
jgi:hypothetical protein